MPATFYSRDQILVKMKREPMKTLRTHCDQRAKGKREMDYTDLSVAFAGARAYKNDDDFRDEFEGDKFWPATFNFREANTLAYFLMMMYGDTKGSPADCAYTNASALKAAFADPNIEAEDVVELIKAKGGIRAMVDAQRAADRATKNPLVAPAMSKKVWLANNQQQDDESRDDDAGDDDDAGGDDDNAVEEDDLQLGPGDYRSKDDSPDEEAEPPAPKHKKVKVEKREPKSSKQWREEKLVQIRKLAHQLGVLVIDPKPGVLTEVCAMRIGPSLKLVIERRENADEWAEIVGLHLEG